MMNTKRLIIVAVGGQGNLLASRIIGEAALQAEISIKMSEIHGMAQRGGVVESAIIMGPANSSIISDGEADILVGFEPLETLRALNKCNSNTITITNLAPVPPFTVAIGKGNYPKIDDMIKLLQKKTAKSIAFDATECARKAGNLLSVNVVLLGALIKTNALPLSAEMIVQAIQKISKPAFVDSNLKAFQLGYEIST